MTGHAALMALLGLVACTWASAQVNPDQPQSGGILRMSPGQTYSERLEIPGTSQQQQEAELAAQRSAGCLAKPLDPKTLALLEPYLNGLVAQSNYDSTAPRRKLNTGSPDPEWTAVYREATRLEDSTAALDKDKSPAMDRALVYLLRFRFLYGDFANDNIDCELAQRAGLTRPWRARPRHPGAVRQLLNKMRQCLPLTGREPFPHQMVLPMEEVRKRIKDLPNACERNVNE